MKSDFPFSNFQQEKKGGAEKRKRGEEGSARKEEGRESE